MKLRTTIFDWIALTIGTLITALPVHFFLIPNNLTISSIAGLAIVLTNFVPLDVAQISLILNIVLLVVAFFVLGRGFGIRTVYCAVLLPIFLEALDYLFPNTQSLTGDVMIDMVCYCFFVSIGLAILFSRNASSGGIDIIAKLMNHFFRMELGQAMSVAGICVSVSAIFVYDIKTGLLSIIGTYLNGVILDHFIFGSNMKRRVCIVSQNMEKIRQFILHELHSGATIYKAYGAYTESEVEEIIAIVDKSEYLKLMNYVTTEDPNAFVTVYAVNEVLYKPKIWIEGKMDKAE